MVGRGLLRAATLLGPNTIDPIESIVAHLNDRGRPCDLVEVDATDPGGGLDGVDLLWACGLLTARLVTAGCDLDVVAAPVFVGEAEPVYRSVIVARASTEPLPDPSGPRRLAINEYGSWSGYRALRHEAARRGDGLLDPDAMEEIVVTGAHVDSVSAVADGRADIAAIDHSIWDWMVANDQAATHGVAVIDRTADFPAPPLSLHRPGDLADAAELTDDLLSFGGPPTLVPATIESYRFMVDV